MSYKAGAALVGLVASQLALAADSVTTAPPAVDLPILGDGIMMAIVIILSIAGFIFGMFWWKRAQSIIIDPVQYNVRNECLTNDIMESVCSISEKVERGAQTFLKAEYTYMIVFLGVFGLLLFIVLGVSLAHPTGHATETIANPWINAALSLMSFIIGSVTSMVSGWIGMRIAVFSNSRTAVMATQGVAEGNPALGFTAAFKTAFRGGITMGFALTSMGVFALFIVVKIVQAYFGNEQNKALQMYECVAAFGLGGSAVACFGRIGGGIFTKAADVGSDLVGKVENNIPEDDPRNPGVIADCIGDNVGDIAGMGSDLFGSFGEASCAALVIAASSPELSSSFTAMMYPLLITVSGILVCMITSLLAVSNPKVTQAKDIEPVLKQQLLVSTILATVVLVAVTFLGLPTKFTIGETVAYRWSALVCVLCGLWSGLIIGYTTEYYTSKAYRPVKEVAESCATGAATNVIYGLALGYLSVLPPIIAMAITIFVSYKLCNLYGYALAALGILSTMATALTIDAYGPISDNAGGFAEMSHMGSAVRDVTDALDAAGNTTAAIGKGFAISSAAFVGLALYGAFVTRVGLHPVNILDERVMAGLLFGAMLPFWFSAMTMKSVGIAAMGMVNEIRRQFQDTAVAEGLKEPDYDACVRIATQAALRQMIAPGCLVMFTPIIVGILFGKNTLAGLLPGAIVSGVQLAISSSNTGGAWDNAKKYIETGALGGKGSPQHAAAVIGDTVGDPLKDTSGPALNILIKLMAIISVVFSPIVQSKIGGCVINWMY